MSFELNNQIILQINSEKEEEENIKKYKYKIDKL